MHELCLESYSDFLHIRVTYRSAVRRVWQAHGLKPQRVETFKVSRDPQFVQKLEDIIGLYLNPPQQAVVFSVDEKSQIQAPDRMQPSLPLKKSRDETMTHDYKRHGTTTLFAALNTLTGKVPSQCRPRHANEDWAAFLRIIDRGTRKDQQIHIIADNYSAHKHPSVKIWLQRTSDFICTLLPLALPGSIWWNASFPTLHSAASGAEHLAAFQISCRFSAPPVRNSAVLLPSP